MGRLRVALAALLAACAPPESEDESESSSDAVVDGRATFAHPEIGAVWHGGSLCTGTLVRPNVVVTAAHCTGFVKDEDVSKASPSFVFQIHLDAHRSRRFAVDRVHAIASPSDLDGSQRWRSRDIALLRLVDDVPAAVARPAEIARTWPLPGARVAVYGYGCTDRAPGDNGRRPGTGTKRAKEYTWSFGLALGFSDTQNVCQGDSGGPLLDLGRNAVVGTNSGYVGDDDAYGNVPLSHAAVMKVIDAWWPRR